MEQIDPKKALIEYGHWGALGISVCLVLMSLLFGSDPQTAKVQQDIDKLLKELEKRDERALVEEPFPDYLNKMKANWATVENAQKGPDLDYMYERTVIKYKYAVPPTHQWINKPEEITLQVDREKIMLNWKPPKELEEKDGKKKEMTMIDGYHLEKKWENGQKEKIFDLKKTDDVEVLEYEDSDVESKMDYFYRVRSYSKNTKAKGGEVINFEGEEIVVSEYTEAIKGTILPVYQIHLLGVAGDVAIIKLSKWVKGDWRTTICHIKKNNKIETSTFIPNVGKVEFNPGWTLKYLTSNHLVDKENHIKVPVIVEGKPVRNPDNSLQYELKKVIIKTYVPMIGYSDERGKKYKLLREDTPSEKKSSPTKPKEK